MSNHEGVFKIMNAIIYYSNTFESYNIAKYINDKTNYELINILNISNYNYDSIFLIFPVHYQSIPKEIKKIIKKIKANKAIVIATYGKISYGHVLYDAQKILNAKIVSAAYIPAKHTYIKNDINFNEYEKLDEIINNISDNNEIKIKKTFKNPLANFFPITRHKLSVRIIKTDNCIDCGKCNKVCKSINNGIIIDKCTKCLRCIYSH